MRPQSRRGNHQTGGRGQRMSAHLRIVAAIASAEAVALVAKLVGQPVRGS
jgi:hypothetical protein